MKVLYFLILALSLCLFLFWTDGFSFQPTSVETQSVENLPKPEEPLSTEWYCDERFKMLPDLRAGKIIGIKEFQADSRNSPIREFSANNEVLETKHILMVELADITTKKTTGKVSEFFVVEKPNSAAADFAIGEFYIFETDSLGVGNRGKGEFDYELEYVKPKGYLKKYNEAHADVEFFRKAAAQDFDPFRDILGLEEMPVFSGGLMCGKARNLVKPNYPAEAKKQKLSGSINVLVLVDENGKVAKAKAFCPKHKSLGEAAENAALNSSFSPVLLNGKAVKTKGTIVYNFVP